MLEPDREIKVGGDHPRLGQRNVRILRELRGEQRFLPDDVQER